MRAAEFRTLVARHGADAIPIIAKGAQGYPKLFADPELTQTVLQVVFDIGPATQSAIGEEVRSRLLLRGRNGGGSAVVLYALRRKGVLRRTPPARKGAGGGVWAIAEGIEIQAVGQS